ncbi:MAG: diphthamide synthesis protein [Candidatus Nanoarchaeia archaeon]
MFDMEVDKLVARIKEKGYKTVLIQLPDGLKPQAENVVDVVRAQTDAECFIWLGSCFGACDVPEFKADLIVQWGHSPFRRKEGW